MLDIVIATGNRHKVRELKVLLPVRGIRWHSLAEFPSVGPVHEHGRTFDANAVIKARAIARATGYLALADDSGIEVDALNGAPGVHSARFAGRHGNDAANNAKLLRLMRAVPASRRQARYCCSLALARPGNRDGRAGAGPAKVIALTRGTWAGRIAIAPKGTGGFGYDPVVNIPRLGKTVAQLPKHVKRRFSHRSVAARRLLPRLRQLVKTR
jgi:XTP/dITP diphosphohydrolase